MRLTPASVSDASLAVLFDRDTTTYVDLEEATEFDVTFGADVTLREVKGFAGGPLELVLGEDAMTLAASEDWSRGALTRTPRARTFRFRLAPGGARTRVYELEAWGVGRPRAPRGAEALARASREGPLAFENARSVSASPSLLTLVPSGATAQRPCGRFTLPLDALPMASVRRAFLVYEGTGVVRSFELQRSLVSQTPVGGLWLKSAASGERTLVDELEPERLSDASEVTLCLPIEADHSVRVKDLRLVVELDDGLTLLDREAQARLGAAFDGDVETTEALPGGDWVLALSRPSSVDALRATAAKGASFELSYRASSEAAWTALTEGDVAGPVVTEVKLSAPHSRPGAPSLSIAELEGVGSGIGPRVARPRLVLTHPRIRHAADALVGERFGDAAYVAGWLEGAPGAVVEVDGVRVSDGQGRFAEAVRRPLSAAEGWSVRVVARLPGGETLERELRMDNDSSGELLPPGSDGVSGGEESILYGAENRAEWATADAQGGRVKLGSQIELEVPEGALSQKTSLGITRKGEDAMPPLDPGMVNVTAPRNGGYRFTPRGQKFLRPVKVRLPYDERLLPEGMSAGTIQTFFFDELAERWVALQRVEVAHAQKQVVSETSHFTFMVNAVLVTPEHPGPVSFDPTSIKSLVAADPGEGIDLIAAPEANNAGTARVSLPLRLPVARGAHQPQLALAYDSGGGNGYLGVGWDVPTSSVAVDTRFGVPHYDGEERYLLDGEPLVPLQLSATCVDGTRARRYAARVERDFRRILRCGADTTSYRWEVTSKDGTLHLYGPSEASRLQGYRTGAGHIAQWFLSRVIDTNGNLTEYAYLTDRLGVTPGPFEEGQGEDFRQLYLSRVKYSGRASREGAGALSGGTSGRVWVELLPQSDSRGRHVREDVVTSARMGFKTVQRYRLGRVQVWVDTDAKPELVREYRLNYRKGDFSKSLLERIELWGLGGVAQGRLFHAHDFEYTSTQSQTPFGLTTEAWHFRDAAGKPALDEDAATASEEASLGVHSYVGIGPTAAKEGGSIGLRVGYSHREGRTVATMVDLNGDSLPDRVRGSGVWLNHGKTRSFTPRAPTGESGEVAFTLPGLGSESGDSLNVAGQATYSSFTANLGYTYTTSTSREFLADADGDGLVDYIGPGEVLFNRARPEDCGATPGGGSCFAPHRLAKTMPALASAAGLLAGDARLAAMRDEVRESLPPAAALHEWTAPFTGAVDITGALEWAQELGTPSSARDGVRLRVYREGELLAEVAKPASSATATPLALESVELTAGQRLYFILSTLEDFPVERREGVDVPLEEVRFSPRIQYTSCQGCGSIASDLTLVEPTGASLFTFDAAEDFKLAGQPLSAVLVPSDGRLRVEWTVAKASTTADDVRVCLQRNLPAEPVRERACEDGDLLSKTLAWAETTTGTRLTADFTAHAGEQLVFRVESDLGVDPSALSSRILGEMLEVCRGTTCAQPPPGKAVTFEAEPFHPLHGTLSHAPLLPLVIPRDGVLVLRSSNVSVSRPPSAVAGRPVFFSARSASRRLFKHREGQQVELRAPVRAGEQILFEAHSEQTWRGGWSLSVDLEDGSGGTARLDVPKHLTYESDGERHAAVSAGTSLFGGGFHGWRYGLWGGSESEPFEPASLGQPLELPTGADGDFIEEAKDLLDDSENDVSRLTRRYAALIPRSAGTRMGNSLGLKPDVPAFVSPDGATFITATSAHGSHRGGFVQARVGASPVAGSFDVGELLRTSLSHSVSAGIGAGFFSRTYSAGTSHQRLDVLDMNGDGIVDVVSPQSAQLTHPRALTARGSVRVPSGLLSESVELSAQEGLGISDAVRTLTPGGSTRAVAGMYPSVGGGVGVNLSAARMDLMDVNGDGLPDQVTRVGNAFRVRLNLGTSFAESYDALPVGLWHEGGAFDLLVDELQRSGVLDETGGREKEVEGRGLLLEAAQLLGTADVVRRSSSVTLQGSAGVMVNESYGVSANWETSLGTTGVALIDVTGDGLVDYVRKSSFDKQLRVKVNLGYGFSTEELRWTLPQWPEDTAPAFVLGALSQLDQGDAVKSVLPKVLGPEGADTVLSNGTHSALPSAGFVVTFPIPLSPVGTPQLHLSAGVDVSPRRLTGYELAFMDINGDGLVDHVLKTSRGGSSAQTRAEAVHARVNQLGGGNLLSGIRRPLGGSISLTYAQTENTVASPHARWALAAVRLSDGQGTGEGHQLQERFAYGEGRLDRSEREFLGFASVRVEQADGTQRLMRFRNDAFESKGLLEREEVRTADGRLYSARVHVYGAARKLEPAQQGCIETTPFFLSPEASCVAMYVPLEATEERFYEGQSVDYDAPLLTRRQEFTYDGYGNVDTFAENGDVQSPGDDVFARMTYLSDGAAERLYLMDRAVRVEMREGSPRAPGRLLRERVGTYGDGRGNLTQHAAAIGDGRWSTTNLDWNEDGTVRRVTRPPNHQGQRYSVDFTYDSSGRFITSTRDVFGYASSATPDVRFGAYAVETDLNGNSIVRTFDDFGRLVKVESPYDGAGRGRATELRYLLEDFPARAVTHNFLPDGRGALRDVRTVVAVDGLGRTLQTKRTVEVFGRGEGMSVSGPIVFDVMGRPREFGQTSFTSRIDDAVIDVPMLHPTSIAYDAVGRPVWEEAPDGRVTVTRYDVARPSGASRPALQMTTTDAAGNVRARYTDVLGRAIATEEHIEGRVLTTHHDYSAVGELSAIRDAAGNTSHFVHDALGRRLEERLPDSGTTRYQYDAAGNLTRKQTANLERTGSAIQYVYDYERLVRVDHPVSADVSFTYGSPQASENGRGRVVRIVDGAGVEERAYGRLGEVTRNVRTLSPLKPGDRPRRFETSTTMDAFGRVLEITYPDGERVHYEYDAGGLLQRAVGHRGQEQEVYLSELRYNVFGQKAYVRYGNGVESSLQYDARSLQLRAVSTRAPGAAGRTLQELRYDYDEVGNVTGLVNALGPARGNQSGEVRYGFGYDALYRLRWARGEAQAKANSLDRFRAEWEYSDIHNMTRSVLQREQVRTLALSPEFERPLKDNRDEVYVYGGVGPHQATRIGDTRFTYDANGNTETECRAKPGQTCDAGAAGTRGHLRRFQWDEENRLSAVVENGQHATRFVYDSAGNRVAKLGRGGASVTIGQFFALKGRGHATKHIFAGSERIATKLLSVPDGRFLGLDDGVGGTAGGGSPNQNGCVPSEYQPNKCDGPAGGPVVVDGPTRVRPATYYYHPDHLGSTQWVTDAQARVHERVEYYPYGEVWRSPRSDSDGGPTHHQAFLFTSKELDEETGLTYFGVRYYDARRARWLSPDPAWGVQGALGLSVYQYAGWNPTNRVDPDGRAFETVWDAANVGMGLHAISQWDENTSLWAKLADVGGLVLDGLATVTPVVPGGVGALLKGSRAADTLTDVARGADGAADAVRAADKAADAAKAAEKTGDVADAAGDAAKGVAGLSRAQARNLQKIDDIITHNAKPGDFSGVASELGGTPIPKPGGGYWDHVTEMRQSVIGLEKAVKGLEGSLNNPNLSPASRQAIEAGIGRAQDVLGRMRSTLAGDGT